MPSVLSRPKQVDFENMAKKRRAIMRDASQLLSQLPELQGVQVEPQVEAIVKAASDVSTDQTDQTLQICAEVLAYYDLAAKRIVDAIPMTILVHYIKAVASQMQHALLEGLQVYGEGASDRCKALLAKDTDIA